MEWYYITDIKNGTRAGPVEEHEIERLINTSVVTRKTPVWREGMNNWMPAGKTEFKPVFTGKSSKTALPSTTKPPLSTLRPSSASSGSDGGLGDYLLSIPSAFAYPLSSGGVIVLVIGTIFFMISRIHGLLASFVNAYFVAYFLKILSSSANSEDEIPTWPTPTNLWDDIIRPLILFSGVWIITFLGSLILLGCAIYCGMPSESLTQPPPGASSEPILQEIFRQLQQGLTRGPGLYFFTSACVFFVVGILLIPMGMVSVAVHDSFAGLNLFKILIGALKILPGYFVTLCLWAFICVILVGGTIAILFFMPKKPYYNLLLGTFMMSFLWLYTWIVTMRILGLLYRNYEDRLGWFDY